MVYDLHSGSMDSVQSEPLVSQPADSCLGNTHNPNIGGLDGHSVYPSDILGTGLPIHCPLFISVQISSISPAR